MEVQPTKNGLILKFMDDRAFTATLYLFSALLQADAAILGFGAIFIIYRLQSLENRLQLIVTELQSHGYGYLGKLSQLINFALGMRQDKAKIAEILYGSGDNYIKMEAVVTIPLAVKSIKERVKYPIVVVGCHIIGSAVFLLTASGLSKNPYTLYLLSWILVVWFGAAIFLAGSNAWKLMTDEDELSLERLDNELYNIMEELHASSSLNNEELK